MNKKTVLLFISLICIFGKYFAIAQNKTTNTQNSLQYYNSTSNLFPQEINTDIRHPINKNSEAIHKNITADNTLQIKRKKFHDKTRRRNKLKKNTENSVTEISFTNSTTSFETPTLQITRRRNLKKRKQKKKNNKNDIFQVTVETEIKNIRVHLQTNSSSTESEELSHRNTLINAKTKDLTSFPIQALDSGQKNESSKSVGIVVSANNSSKTFVKKNRCIENNGGCSQICKVKGKRKCSCIRGYKLAKDRKKCVDLNECRMKNGGCKAICQNTLGAYYCDCHSGFRLSDDLKSCQDINECHLRNGHGPCQDTCINTFGSYICDCSRLNGTRLGKDKHSCEDINECEEMNPGCSHFCINTRMGGFCSCPEGMELMSDFKTCQDVDECEDASVRSSCVRGCVNTIGSYYCEEDFQNDQNMNKTKIPSCPPLDLPKHGFITCFRNKSLPYDTFTKNGRRIIKNSPGTKCQLECPIGFKLLGEGRFVCGLSGKWIKKKKGLCIKAPYPKLQCPPDQTLYLEKGRRTVLVHFPSPQTNIRWKIVKSYPKWAKNLKGKLGEGRHSILFSVTDPASKLSSTCSFFVVIKK